jgi:hypothetical protein
VDQTRRVALCDLAIHDPGVIEGHYRNTLIVGGRFRTKFKNAFKVRLPVPASSILDVRVPTTYAGMPSPDIRLEDLR